MDQEEGYCQTNRQDRKAMIVRLRRNIVGWPRSCSFWTRSFFTPAM